MFGARQAILVGHSMGGLIALSAYNLSENKDLFLGVVTLGAPLRGTPLAIPKLMRATFKEESFRDRKKVFLLNLIYFSYINNFLSGFRESIGGKRVTDILHSKEYDLLNEGFRANAFDGSAPGIPEMSFLSRYPFGVFERNEYLSLRESYLSHCQDSSLYSLPLLDPPPTRIENTGCFFNYVDRLRRVDQKITPSPHIIAYAGYLTDVSERENTFLQSIINEDTLVAVLKNTTEEYEQQGQRWLASLFRKIPAYKKDHNGMNDYWLSDGVVSVSSALSLEDGETLFHSSSNPSSLTIDESRIRTRLSTSIHSYHLLRDYTHKEVVTGKHTNDSFLFESINRTLLGILDEYDHTKNYTLDETEKIDLISSVEQNIESSFPNTQWSLVDFKVDAHPTKADYAFLRYTVHKETYTRYAGEWKKIGKRWYMVWKHASLIEK